MDRVDVIALLNEIEKSLPVGEWRYDELMIWPVVKWLVFSKWYEREHPNSIGNINNQFNKSKFQRVNELFISFISLVKVNFKKDQNVETIYCGASTYRVDYNNEYINKYFQPLIEGEETRSLQIEYSERVVGKNYKDIGSVLFINTLYPVVRLSLAFKEKSAMFLPSYAEFEKRIVNDLKLDMSDFYPTLGRRLKSLKAYTIIADHLLKKYRPKKIYGLSYYNLPMMALHYAANRLGINNVDIQHGGQGTLHPMYNFSVVPENGYNTLPRKFYTWDNVSAKTIRRWISMQSYHEVLVFGNPWITYQLNNNYVDKKISESQIILFTLQEYILDDYLLQTIKDTPPGYEWWLRLHPRMLESKKKIIMDQLKDYSITSNIEITKASCLPLPQLLSSAYVHISKFSGSIIEGVLCNTPSIIIDPVGAEIYKDYILEGSISTMLNRDSKELLSCILSFSR